MKRSLFVLGLAIVLGLLEEAVAAMTVQCMPDGLVRPYAWVGRELPVWGRVLGGAAPYTYEWDFGDGTPRATGTVGDPRHILVAHTYQAAGAYMARLTVTDAGGDSASAIVRLRVTPMATLREQVNAAIQDGLRYLYLNQYADGSWYAGPYGGGSYVAGTGMAVLAFEEHGYRVRDGGIYADTVQAGLDYIFRMARVVTVDAPSDAYNGNGLGCGFYTTTSGDLRHGYEVGIAMMAIVASGTPDAVIQTGPLAGKTYRYAVEEAVDWCAWAQNDSGSAMGGWRYTANFANPVSSDNSVSQWPAIGLEAAETGWGISAPAFVKERLLAWLAYSQNANGGFGYDTPSSPNFARSAGALCELAYADLPVTDMRVRRLCDYFRANWGTVGFHGNKQNMYAMYGFAKGARISIPPIRILGDLDWQEDYNSYLVGKQRYSFAGGSSWAAEHQYISDSPPHFGTALSLLVLSPGVFCLPPVAVAGPDKEAGPGQPVIFDASGSYHQDPTGSIVSYQWDVDGDGIFDLDGMTVIFEGYPDRGTEYTVNVTLKVVGSVPDPSCQEVQVAFDHLEVKVIPGIQPLSLYISSPLEMTAPPGASLSWTATVLAGGAGVADATIRVRDGLSSVDTLLRTGPEGTATYETRVPPGATAGTYQIVFGPAAKAGYVSSSTSVRWVNVGNPLYLVVLPQGDQICRPGRTAEWRVAVFDSGSPVAKADVLIVDEVQGRTQSLRTSVDGTLVYATAVPGDRLPGAYSVTFGPAVKAGYRGSGVVARRVVVPGKLTLIVSDPEPRDVLAGTDTSWVAFAALGANGIAGASVDVADEITGARVTLFTDARGFATYTLSVPLEHRGGTQRVVFGPARKAGLDESEEIVCEVRAIPRLRMAVTPLSAAILPGESCTFRVRVESAEGTGLEGALVRVEDQLSGRVEAIRTGSDGRADYVASAPAAGTSREYEVRFGAPELAGYGGGESVRAKVIVVPSDARARVACMVRDAATAEGIPDAVVELTGPASRSGRTDSRGISTFEEVPPGTYTVTASAAGFASASEELVVRPKEVGACLLLRRQRVSLRPEVVSVRSQYSSSGSRTIFLDGVDLELQFAIEPDWKGSRPGRYRFIVVSPHSLPSERRYEQDQPTRRFNVGRDFGPGGRLRAAIISADGRESDPVDAGFEVAPSDMADGLPGTLVPPRACLRYVPMLGGFSYCCDVEVGLPVIDMEEACVPKEVPIFGGKGIDFKTLVELESTVTSDGRLELGASGTTSRWAFLGDSFELRGEVALESLYDESRDRWLFEGGSIALGLEGTKGFGPYYTLVPPPLPPVPVYLRGELTVDLLFKGEVTGFVEGAPALSAAFEPSAELTVGAGAGVYQALSVEAQGTGRARARIDCTGRYPTLKDRFRGLWLDAEVSVCVTALIWKQTWDLWQLGEICVLGPECEGEGGLASIPLLLNPADFCLLGREYLSRRRNLLTGAGGGDDGTVVEAGVFPYPNPRAAVLGDKILLVWTRDDGTAQPENRTATAWSLFDGERWSPPEAIEPDGTADFAPDVAATASGILCAWQDLKEPLDPGAGLVDALVRSEISVAAFDAARGTWSPAERLTDNAAYDRSPNLAAAGSRALLVWVRNAAGDLLGSPEAPNSIVYSEWGPGGWTNPRIAAEGLSAVMKTSLAFDGRRGYFVFVQDEDGDGATPGDRDLYLLTYDSGIWSSLARLTHDEADDSNPRVSFTAAGEPLLLWHRDGRIESCRNFEVQNSAVVSDAPAVADALEFALVEGPGQERTILWSGRSEAGRDLYACVSSRGVSVWGEPVRLTSDREDERMVTGCALPGGDVVAAYARVPVPEDAGSVRDLVVRMIPLAPDLSVSSEEISLGFEDGKPEQPVIFATVRNAGIGPAEEATMTFRLQLADGSEVLLGDPQEVAGPLEPGSAASVRVPLPPETPRGKGVVCVEVALGGVGSDVYPENNWACAPIWFADLEIAALRSSFVGDGSLLVTATTRNLGDVASPACSVELRTRGGRPVGEVEIPDLEPGEAADASFAVSVAMAGSDGFSLEAEADAAKVVPERVRSNNRRTLWVPLGVRGSLFRRGDSNADGTLDISDAVYTLNYLFLGGPSPGCEDAADVNDDGRVDISDPVYLLNALFAGGPAVPPPSPEPGLDLTPDGLGCENPGA